MQEPRVVYPVAITGTGGKTMKNWKMMMASLLLAAGVVGSVNGAVLYFDIADVDINDGSAYTYNPLTGTGAFGIGAFGVRLFPGDYGVESAGGWEILTSDGSAIILLDGTETIDASSGTWSSGFKSFSHQAVGDTKYYGIRYDGGSGSGFGYGWIQVQHDVDRDAILMASSFNEGGSLTAGQTSEGGGGGGGSAVPEPGTAAMLGIGVVMLSAARRRFRREA